MNRFILNQTGGFPLTQDRLAWLQDSFIGAFNGIGAVSGATAPVVLSGVEYTSPAQDAVSDGWVYHPTLGLMPFVGGSIANGMVGVAYEDAVTPLTFENGTAYNVQIRRYAHLYQTPVNNIVPLVGRRFMPVVGAANRTGWQTIAGTYGNLQWRRDNISNMVHVTASVNVPLQPNSVNYIQVFATSQVLPRPNPAGTLVPFMALLGQGNLGYEVEGQDTKLYSREGLMSGLPTGLLPISGAPDVFISIRPVHIGNLFVQGVTPTFNAQFAFSYHF